MGNWRLDDCTLYVTPGPCPMCAGDRDGPVPMVVFGCTDPKAGACGTLYQIANDPRLNHRAQVVGGVLSERLQRVVRLFRSKTYGSTKQS